MKILDLFCGLGGWSKGFAEAGFECTGVDNRNLGYPYRFIQADVLDWEPDQDYDVVCASPPCAEFSDIKRFPGTYHYSERIGLHLVYRAFALMEKIKPRYWVIENVRGLSEFIDKPIDKIKYGKGGRKTAFLWGKFPQIGMMKSSFNTENVRDIPGWNILRRAERARIPPQLSEALAETIMRSLTVEGECKT